MVENWTVLVVCTRVWTQEEDGGRRSQDTQAGTLGGGRDTGTLVGGGGTRVGCYRDTLGGFQNATHPHIGWSFLSYWCGLVPLLFCISNELEVT